MTEKLKFMIVVGEASGDSHAARLVKRLRELAPNAEFFGATGIHLREESVETIVKADELAIVGLPEIARALPMFWNVFQRLKKAANERRPDAVILVDFPDFNLKLAKSLKKSGLKIIYYISPQLWAWRKYRIKTIEKYVDLLLTILPFEKNWYAENGVHHVEYVGNPLAGEIKADSTREEFCAKHDLDERKPVIALLPGSRHKEISRILPPLLETSALMAEKNADLQFVIALGAERRLQEVREIIEAAKAKKLRLPQTLKVVVGETREVLNAANVAAVTSGTATLETGIIGTPMAIVYKSSAFNYKLLRPLIDVPHFGLINLIAEERLAKELIQDDFTKEILAEELFRLLEPAENQQMRGRLREVADTLGHGGTARRAAQVILRELQKV
jgi:lipid-A-disaccharide synthase